MKFKVGVKELEETLRIVGSVVALSPVSPEYGCVQLVGKKSLVVRATDLVAFIEGSLDVEGTLGSEKVLVPLKPLLAFVQGASGSLVVETTEKVVKLSGSGGRRAEVKTIDDSNYTTWPAWKKLNEVGPSDDLIEAVKLVHPCASSVLVTPTLYNVHLGTVGQGLLVEAADGYRYASQFLKLKGSVINVLVPLRSALKLVGMPPNQGYVMGVSDSLLGLQADGYTFYSRLNTGNFPLVKPNLPTKFKVVVRLEREELLNLLNVAMAYSDEAYRTIEVSVSPELVEVASSVEATGSFRGRIKPKQGRGQSIDILLDAKSLSWFAEVSKGDVILGFSGSLSPVVARDSERKEFVYALWPLVRKEQEKERE